MILKRRNVEVEAFGKDEIHELIADGFEPLEAEPEELKLETDEEIEDMTVAELKELAESKGIKVSSALRKQDLIDLLEDSDEGSTESETTAAAADPDGQE